MSYYFFAYLSHIRDIIDDVERCSEMAGAGRNVEWIVPQTGNKKNSRWSLFVDEYKNFTVYKALYKDESQN